MRQKILLTNDDGIEAPGLKSLCRALEKADMADLVVIAPLTEKSGTGAGITWDRPILIKEMPWEGETQAWAVDGTPADCVKMATRVILGEKPDFVVSGINAGSNAGRNVLHSGTVGAVIEGVFRGIPGMAISCENGKVPNFHVAELYVAQLVEYLWDNPLGAGSFLNVNVPHAAQECVKGFKLTRQGKGRWGEDPTPHIETAHGQTYWLGGKPEELEEDPDCDIAYLREGYLTAVPLHVHELTDRVALEARREEFEHFLLERKSVVEKGGAR